MNIQTSHTPPASFRPVASQGLAAVGSQAAPADTYGPARPENLEGLYRRPVFAQGRREAVQVAGLGVMLTGALTAAAIGGRFGPAMMVGALFAGLALVAAA